VLELGRTKPSIAAPLLKMLWKELGILSMTHWNASPQFSRRTMVSGVKAELFKQVFTPADARPL
jgi:hypothetical protein